MKKSIPIVIAAAALLLAACGGGESSTTSSSIDDTSSSTSTSSSVSTSESSGTSSTSEIPPITLTIEGDTTLLTGDEETYTAPEGENVIWTSSDDTILSIVEDTGVATALSAGTVTITATGSNGAGNLEVTITDPVVLTITGSTSLTAGDTTTYTVAGTTGVTWTSSDPEVVTIDPATGAATAVGGGVATITAVTETGHGTLEVTVTDLLTITGESELLVGATATYVAEAEGTLTWTSTNEDVLTIDEATGEATAISAGRATIIVESDAYEAGSFVVNVVTFHEGGEAGEGDGTIDTWPTL